MKKLKDKKITILEKKSIYIPGIGADTTITPIADGENIWAYYRQASGNEKVAASAIAARVDVIFEINWRDDLTTAMLIDFRGVRYNITRIDDYEGYKNDLRIFAFNAALSG